MENDEIISLIQEICTELLIYNVQGRFYDERTKIDVIGTIYKNSEPKNISFFINKDDIIDKSYLDIMMKIKGNVNENQLS